MKKISILYLVAFLLVTAIHCQADDSDILGQQQIPIQPIQPTPTIPKVNQTIPIQQKPTRRQFKLDMNTLQQYRYEVLAVVCILFYLVYYRKGKADNYQLIEKFYKKTRGYIDTNFSHVGFTKNSGEDPFIAESPSQAMFYATGRNNVNYLEIKFNLLKRQDLLYHFIYQTIYPEKDTMTIDIPTHGNVPIVFCIANKKKLKNITQSNIDLAKLVGNFEVKGINPSFSTLGESSEILDSIFDSNTCKKINDLSSLIYSIHYTDQKLFSQSQGHMRATLYVSEKNTQKYLPALQLLFHLVDKIKDQKISASYKTKAYKSRQSFNASVEKQKLEKHKQQLRKKKEQKRKQQQAWLRTLPPEKQKREDQKRKKKQINKLLKSRVMKVA